MLKSCTTEKLFNEIKDGDVFGFWRNGLFSQMIRYFQKDEFADTDTDEICHVGIVYNVKKTIMIDNINCFLEILTFNLGEQTALHGGLFDKWEIHKYNKNVGDWTKFKYIIKKDTKEQILYWRSYDLALTRDQIMRGIQDQKKEVGKIYGFGRFITSIPLFRKILSKYFGKNIYIPWFMKSRVCSGNVWYNQKISGRISYTEIKQDLQPTPEFICLYNEKACKGKLYKITDFQDNLITT